MAIPVLEVGSVVRMVSGGPRLTVVALEEHSGGRMAAKVAWFTGSTIQGWGTLQSTLVDAAFLVPARREAPES